MGLFVSVLKNVKKLTELEIEMYNSNSSLDVCIFQATQTSPVWNDKIKNLTINAWYAGDYDKGFSYAYSTHSIFRNKLVKLTNASDKVLFSDGTINWTEVENYEFDFKELVYFSDCEGCLDWETSEKILNDFLKYEDIVNKMEDSYFVTYFMDWIEVLKIGAIEGNVINFG